MPDFDLLVVGGGPAGMTAATTAALAGADVLLADPQLGGHLTELSVVDCADAPTGTSGYTYSLALQEHLAGSGAAHLPAIVEWIDRRDGVAIAFAGRIQLSAHRVLVATGRGPGLNPDPILAGWVGRGVFHCGSCDGPLLRGAPVVALVEGPTGLAEALAVRPFAESITVLASASSAAHIAGLEWLIGERPVRLTGTDVLERIELTSGRILDCGFLLAKDEGAPEPPPFLQALGDWSGLARAGHVVADSGPVSLDRMLEMTRREVERLLAGSRTR